MGQLKNHYDLIIWVILEKDGLVNGEINTTTLLFFDTGLDK
jgi:hypothetical protein